LGSVTTAGLGAASKSVAHVGSTAYVKPPARLAVPPGVVIATVLAPTVPAGVTAVTVDELTTVTDVAATPPTVKLVAPVRFVPVSVIVVPPVVGPDVGVTDVIVGFRNPYVEPVDSQTLQQKLDMMRWYADNLIAKT